MDYVGGLVFGIILGFLFFHPMGEMNFPEQETICYQDTKYIMIRHQDEEHDIYTIRLIAMDEPCS